MRTEICQVFPKLHLKKGEVAGKDNVFPRNIVLTETQEKMLERLHNSWSSPSETRWCGGIFKGSQTIHRCRQIGAINFETVTQLCLEKREYISGEARTIQFWQETHSKECQPLASPGCSQMDKIRSIASARYFPTCNVSQSWSRWYPLNAQHQAWTTIHHKCIFCIHVCYPYLLLQQMLGISKRQIIWCGNIPTGLQNRSKKGMILQPTKST